MNQPYRTSDSGSDQLAELLAGGSLHALDDVEQAELDRATGADPLARRAFDDFSSVAGLLADALPAPPPPADLRARLLGAVAAERSAREAASPPASADRAPAPGPTTAAAPERSAESPDGVVVPFARRHRKEGERQPGRRVPLLAAAASVAIAAVLGAGAAVGLRDNSGSDRDSAVVQALAAPGSRVVTLSGQQGGGTAVVNGSSVALVVSGLPANDTSSETYVLWAVEQFGAQPKAVTTFDVADGQPVVLNDQPLPSGEAAATRFAVSREAGRTAPAAPTTIVLDA